MAIAGRVAIVPKGEWSQSVTYDKLDLVTHNGNTFIAYKSSVGVEPVDGDTWMLVMQGIDPQDIENIIDGTTAVGNALKLNGLTAEEFVSNENLLINADFKNPVNSSGKTEWTSGSGAVVDKWVYGSSKASMELNNDGLIVSYSATTATVPLYQILPYELSFFNGETFTLSAKVDGVVYSKTYTMSNLTTENSFQTGGMSVGSDVFLDFQKSAGQTILLLRLVMKAVKSITIEWIKLELGKQATPFVPPNKEVEKLKCGVANADTVDGYHASAFVRGASPFFSGSETVLDWANNPNGVYKKMALTEIGIPSDGVASTSGFYTLDVDDGARKLVTFHAWASNVTKQRAIWQSSWKDSDWKITGIDTFLPLDGSVPMSGNLTALEWIDVNNRNDNTKKARVGNNVLNGNAYLICYDSANAKWRGLNIDLSTDMGEGLQYVDAPNGVETYHTVLHTGNSAKVVQATSAPSDTTAVWVDSANKVSKIYIDGAWTALE